MRYSSILIDTMSLLYKLRSKAEDESTILVSAKHVYKDLVARFIKEIDRLTETYLLCDGKVYLLFDNPTSRYDMQKSFYFAQRKQIFPHYKEQRAKAPKEFYNSLDLIRYYYLTNTSKYICVQISNLEADDLVKPVIENYCNESADHHVLMITNDYDWTRYLSTLVDWLPELSKDPQTIQDFVNKKGFYPTEQSVIAYKSVFGDPSDNISGVIGENDSTLNEFIEIYQRDSYLSPDVLISMSCKSDLLQKYKILKAIRDNERQFRINLQLTSTIPVSKKHLEATTSRGRDSKVITESIEIVIGLREPKHEFVFGQLKGPKRE